jgi:hypothetical protein
VERSLFFLIARQVEPITHALHTSGEDFLEIFICACGILVGHLLKRMWIDLAVRSNYEGGTRLESLEMRRITGIGEERAEMGRKGVGERF